MKKVLKVFAISTWSLFGLFGFALAGVFFAMKLGLTNVPGAISFDSQYLSGNAPQTASVVPIETTASSTATSNPEDFTQANHSAAFFCVLSVLFEHYPDDAKGILAAYEDTHTFETASHQISLLKAYADPETKSAIETCEAKKDSLTLSLKAINGESTSAPIPWTETPEWKTFASGIVKEKPTIDRVSSETGVSSRLIAAMVVSEQMRLYDSNRQAFKNYFSPLGILGTETQFSLGVTGVKAGTAQAIETHLSNPTSPFYPGPQFQSLITYASGTDPDTVRISRLVDEKDHYYSYLYAALFIREIEAQWQRAGFDVSHKPGILATLWNIGFGNSKPNATPQIGGAEITVGGKTYTFGSLAYEFYYSGALQDAFPY
ncbi:MAG TPA: hypothetical protein VFM02_04530 [Candidatus Paceibacterota bacterium]|nr:hypothetical protein [Candidatus Paceibacterota bacterium]